MPHRPGDPPPSPPARPAAPATPLPLPPLWLDGAPRYPRDPPATPFPLPPLWLDRAPHHPGDLSPPPRLLWSHGKIDSIFGSRTCSIQVPSFPFPHSLAVLSIRFPPSKAVFQESIAEPVLRPIFAFLDQINSSFMVNLYPYLTYKETPFIPLDFAMFIANPKVFNFTDDNTGLMYTKLFDMLVDSLHFATSSLGFGNLPLVVIETGWPSEGNPDDAAASLQNAAIFNQRLVDHITKPSTRGIPLMPDVPVPTFIFSLFDEDLKPGAPTEKHWGLLYANGTMKYNLTISSKQKTRIIKNYLLHRLLNSSYSG